MANYCNSKELEEWWAGWKFTGDKRNWEKMTEMLYLICLGIAKKFKPIDDEEYHNLASEAMTKLLLKIKSGKFNYTPSCKGGSPLFNLVTTTVQRLLCSYKNSQRDSKKRHSKYVLSIVREQAPELLSSVKDIYDCQN